MTSGRRRRKRGSGAASADGSTGSSSTTATRRKIKTNARALRSLQLISPSLERSIRGDVDRIDGPNGEYSAFYMQTTDGPTVVVATNDVPGDDVARQLAADVVDYYRDGDAAGQRAPTRLIIAAPDGEEDAARTVMTSVSRTLNGQDDRRFGHDLVGTEQLEGGVSGFVFRIREADLTGPRPRERDGEANDDGGGLVGDDGVRRAPRAALGLPPQHPDADLAVSIDRVTLMTVAELEAEAGKSNRLRTGDYQAVVNRLGKYHRTIEEFRSDTEQRRIAVAPIAADRVQAIAALTATRVDLSDQRKRAVAIDRQLGEIEGLLAGFRAERPNATEERQTEIDRRLETERGYVETLRRQLQSAREEAEGLAAQSDSQFNQIRGLERELDRRSTEDRAALRRAQATLRDDAEDLRKAAQSWLADRKETRTDKKYAAVTSVVSQAMAQGQHAERLKEATEQVWGTPFAALPASPITLLNTGTASEVFAVRTNGPIGESDTTEGFAKRAAGVGAPVNDTMINLGYNPTTATLNEDPHLIARQVVSSRLGRLLETSVIAEEIFSVGSDGKVIGITARAGGTQFQRNITVDMQQFPGDDGDPNGGPVTDTKHAIARIDLENNGAVQRNLSILQLLDALTGQMDRHLGNIFIDPESGAVVGIDNDMAFPRPIVDGEGQVNADAFKTVNGPTVFDQVDGRWIFLQSQVDRELAESILDDGFAQEFERLIRGEESDPERLGDAEVAGAMARLTAIKATLAALQTAGTLMEPGDWGPDSFQAAVTGGKRRVQFNDNDQELNFVVRMNEAMTAAASGTDPRRLQAE